MIVVMSERQLWLYDALRAPTAHEIDEADAEGKGELIAWLMRASVASDAAYATYEADIRWDIDAFRAETLACIQRQMCSEVRSLDNWRQYMS